MARSLFGARGGAPFTTAGWRKMVARLGVAAKLSFKAHPHMFRHACGFQLANQAPTPAPCKRISAIATSSTPCATPSCRPRASRTSGATDADCPISRRFFPFIKCIFADAGYQGPKDRGRHRQTGTWKLAIVERDELHRASFANRAAHASVTAGQQCQAALPSLLFLVGQPSCQLPS